MKNIGTSFFKELKLAGLLGLPFSWGADGEIYFSEGMTEEQIAAVNAVYAAHDPLANVPTAKIMTPLAFIERFTESEQIAVVTAAMQTPALRLWYDKLMAAQDVVFDDERLIEGMDELVQFGLITQARCDEILG